jgi:hypothetical protein
MGTPNTRAIVRCTAVGPCVLDADPDAAVLGRVGVGALCLDVEVLLAVRIGATFEDMRAFSQASSWITQLEGARRDDQLALCTCFARIGDHRQFLQFDRDQLAGLHGASSEVAMISATGMPQKWISFSTNSGSSGMMPADLVLAGNILVGEDSHNARNGCRLRYIELFDVRMGRGRIVRQCVQACLAAPGYRRGRSIAR